MVSRVIFYTLVFAVVANETFNACYYAYGTFLIIVVDLRCVVAKFVS